MKGEIKKGLEDIKQAIHLLKKRKKESDMLIIFLGKTEKTLEELLEKENGK